MTLLRRPGRDVTVDDRSTRPDGPPRRRANGRARRLLVMGVARLVVVVVLLAVWQLVVRIWLPAYLPTPTGVAREFFSTLGDHEFDDALSASVVAIVLGLVIGCSVGVPFGLLTGRVPWLRRFSAPYIGGLYALPLIVLVPTITIWLGYSDSARLVLIIVAAALPCAVNTSRGAQLVPKQLLEVTQVLGVSKLRALYDVVLPATLPFVVGGVQIAVGRAIIASVSVEFLASLRGVGTFILVNAQSFHQNTAFVGLVVLAALGGLGRIAVAVLLRVLAPWHGARS